MKNLFVLFATAILPLLLCAQVPLDTIPTLASSEQAGEFSPPDGLGGLYHDFLSRELGRDEERCEACHWAALICCPARRRRVACVAAAHGTGYQRFRPQLIDFHNARSLLVSYSR